MRAMLLVLLFFLGALAQERCSLRGLAFDSATRQPLGGVHIRLIPSPFFGVQAYGALSDESGHFSIVPIPPGSYLVDAEYPGFSYVPVPKSGRTMPTLVIQAGQQLDDFPIQMAAHAIISGRVFDARGEPLDWVYVEAASTSPNDVGLRLRQDLLHHANMVPTNESGEYRLAVQPGKYRVQSSQTSRDDIRPDGTLEDVFYNRTPRNCRSARGPGKRGHRHPHEPTAGIAYGRRRDIFRGVAPGRYKIYAVDPRFWGLLHTAAEFRDFEGAESIEVGEGENTTRDLKCAEPYRPPVRIPTSAPRINRSGWNIGVPSPVWHGDATQKVSPCNSGGRVCRGARHCGAANRHRGACGL